MQHRRIKRLIETGCILLLIMCGYAHVYAQLPRIGAMGAMGRSTTGGSDSFHLEHRVNDTILLYYHYLNDVVPHYLDSSINNFYKYFPLRSSDAYLGNIGNPGYDLIFHPVLKAGWDAGFHALDLYSFPIDSARFYQTTGPYTELRYLVGPKQEQVIDVFHTQNHKRNFNISGHYRKINSPGYFRNQNTNDDNYAITARFDSRKQRYHAYAAVIGNNEQTGENGGIVNDADLKDPIHSDRQTIATFLGGNNASSGFSFFTTSIPVKTEYKEKDFLFSHEYDWGRGDSVKINDTTVMYRFYPIFRIQHTFLFEHLTEQYRDTIVQNDTLDAYFYRIHYPLISNPQDSSIVAWHDWKRISNDLSLVQFPFPKNQNQFLREGITDEWITGTDLSGKQHLHNIFGHVEYRNKTRNQKWDMRLYGALYLAGDYFGNYHALASLSRYVSRKLGYVELHAENINRTPSAIYQRFVSNRFAIINPGLNKENITLLQAAAVNPALHYALDVKYYLFTNYTYLKNFYQSDQYHSPFTLLQVHFQKDFRVNHFHLHTDAAYQQITGNPPLALPAVWTWERLTYENYLFNYHLQICTGIEIKYNTPFDAPDYSPLLGQFVYQNQQRIRNSPEIAALLHFRIRSFVGYIRAERLNSFIFNPNFAAPHYPYPDFGVRIGVKWGLIN
ncbi:putative porin [Thermoflavifilum thermophilum]|uniref:putative porin n=1 Tax=Thermoflavifilum thermophilum TaxID=1393122 RepID=UPI001160117C|nr:putative porin [Thermoflavifilum thermophilum]